jgi:hypothetical protein
MGHNESSTSLATSTKGLEHMSGKGSRPRPFSVQQDKFASNWDAIFGKKKQSTSDQSNNQLTNKEQHEATVDRNLPTQNCR